MLLDEKSLPVLFFFVSLQIEKPFIIMDEKEQKTTGISDIFHECIGEQGHATLSEKLKTFLCNNEESAYDMVNRPRHYNSNKAGVECIEVTSTKDFCTGNAIKYLWRCGLKEEDGLSHEEKERQDINKAIWYVNYKIKMLKDEVKPTDVPAEEYTEEYDEYIRNAIMLLADASTVEDYEAVKDILEKKLGANFPLKKYLNL